jgi:hypothetical protein
MPVSPTCLDEVRAGAISRLDPSEDINFRHFG